MKTFRLSVVVLLLTIPFSAASQYTDAGVWGGVTLKKDLPKGFDLDAEFQFRSELMGTHLATVLSDLGASYKINKWMKTALTYRFGVLNGLDNVQSTRHRFAADLTFDHDFGKPNGSFRIRYQAGQRSTDENGISDLRDAIRYRVKGDIKLIKKTRLASSFELFQGSTDYGFELTDWRWKIGIQRKLKKRQYLTVGYLLQNELHTNDPLMEHVLTIGYSYEFK